VNYAQRVADCREQLAANEAVVLFPSVDMQYISGFTDEPMERHLFLFVTRQSPPVFVAPEMYRTEIQAESRVDDIRTYDDGEDPLVLLTEVIDELGIDGGRLYVDDRMWARFTQDLRAIAPDAAYELASSVLSDLRITKSDEELTALEEAGEVADAAMQDVRNLGERAVGMTEAELAAFIEERLGMHGGSGTSFAPIVGSGPNGAKPHHRHSEREIRAGDPVVLDFGTRIDHYPSDQTRTVVFGGEPPAEFETVHEVVRDAQQAARETAAPGTPAEAVDTAAREIVAEAGYADQFVHRTGHGVGLDVHEAPYIVDGNERVLEPGMVFSIEPGVYLDEEFGVRVEDLIVVTEDGCRRLNHTRRGWRV